MKQYLGFIYSSSDTYNFNNSTLSVDIADLEKVLQLPEKFFVPYTKGYNKIELNQKDTELISLDGRKMIELNSCIAKDVTFLTSKGKTILANNEFVTVIPELGRDELFGIYFHEKKALRIYNDCGQLIFETTAVYHELKNSIIHLEGYINKVEVYSITSFEEEKKHSLFTYNGNFIKKSCQVISSGSKVNFKDYIVAKWKTNDKPEKAYYNVFYPDGKIDTFDFFYIGSEGAFAGNISDDNDKKYDIHPFDKNGLDKSEMYSKIYRVQDGVIAAKCANGKFKLYVASKNTEENNMLYDDICEKYYGFVKKGKNYIYLKPDSGEELFTTNCVLDGFKEIALPGHPKRKYATVLAKNDCNCNESYLLSYDGILFRYPRM